MIESIINYKLKDFIKQPQEVIEEYTSLLSFSSPKETKNAIYKMKLKDVDFIKTSIGDGTMKSLLEIITLVQEIEEKDIEEMHIVDFFSILASIKAQTKTIIENESKVLVSRHPNLKWELVEGASKMSKFGLYNTLESLSGGDITKYEYISNMPYDEVFTVMYMRTIQRDLMSDMEKLKTNT